MKIILLLITILAIAIYIVRSTLPTPISENLEETINDQELHSSFDKILKDDQRSRERTPGGQVFENINSENPYQDLHASNAMSASYFFPNMTKQQRLNAIQGLRQEIANDQLAIEQLQEQGVDMEDIIVIEQRLREKMKFLEEHSIAYDIELPDEMDENGVQVLHQEVGNNHMPIDQLQDQGVEHSYEEDPEFSNHFEENGDVSSHGGR